MDQLTAYRILRLQPGCSLQQMKEAYAALSKEFHPEEHPEEFQQIHEAYSLLSKTVRRQKGSALRPTDMTAASQAADPAENDVFQNQETLRFAESDQPETTAEALQREQEATAARRKEEAAKWQQVDREDQRTEEPSPETEGPAWDFDGALNQAEEREQQRIHEKVLRALAEMEVLLTPAYRNKMKLFRAFFKKPEYQEALKTPEFLQEFAELLENTKLKSMIYDYFIDYYRLRGMNRNELIPEAAALYDVLERKRGMQAKKKANAVYVIPPAVVAGLRSGIRQGARSSDTIMALVWVFIILVGLIWLYRKLHENHSSIFSQTMVAIVLSFTQLLAVFYNYYGSLFGSEDNALLFAFFVVAGAFIWLIVLMIATVIQKIRAKFRK